MQLRPTDPSGVRAGQQRQSRHACWRNQETPLITLIIFDRRKKGTSHEDYVRHHEQHHAQLFTSQPEVRQHVRRYVQKHPTSDLPPGGSEHLADVDGVTEISRSTTWRA